MQTSTLCKITLVRVIQGKFIITHGKDRINQIKFNQGTTTQGTDNVSYVDYLVYFIALTNIM